MARRSSGETGAEAPTFVQGLRRVPLDPKGRITIPLQCRSIYEDELRRDWVVCLVADRQRIDVLPAKRYWEKYDRIVNGNSSHPDDIASRRRLMAGTEIKALDREGRLTLSKEMQTIARIGPRVALVWMREWLEIWSEVEFNSWLNEAPLLDEIERNAASPRQVAGATAAEEQTSTTAQGEPEEGSLPED